MRFLIAAVLFAAPASAETVTSVYDGDTFRVGDESIRISNIDTPERGSRAECDAERFLASIAQKEAERLLTGPDVTITREPRPDKYGRTLARVTIGSEDFGDLMVAANVAVYWAGRQHDWCGERRPDE